jgi:hypothetical protein
MFFSAIKYSFKHSKLITLQHIVESKTGFEKLKDKIFRVNFLETQFPSGKTRGGESSF